MSLLILAGNTWYGKSKDLNLREILTLSKLPGLLALHPLDLLPSPSSRTCLLTNTVDASFLTGSPEAMLHNPFPFKTHVVAAWYTHLT